MAQPPPPQQTAVARPPPRPSGSMRQIIMVQQPKPTFEGVTPETSISEAEFEQQTGLDIIVPSGARITKVETTAEGYKLTYSYPVQETITRQQFEEGYTSGKYTLDDMVRIARTRPEFFGYREGSTKALTPEQYEKALVQRSKMEALGQALRQTQAERAFIEAQTLGELEARSTTGKLTQAQIIETMARHQKWTYVQPDEREAPTGRISQAEIIESFSKQNPWADPPTMAELNTMMESDKWYGRAIPLTPLDVYAVVSTTLLAYAAFHSIINLTRNIAVAKSYASRETIRQIFKESPDEQFYATFSKQISPMKPWEQPTKVFWQNIQGPLEVKPEIMAWQLAEIREANLYQPIALIKSTMQRGGLITPEPLLETSVAIPSTWKAPYDLLQIKMLPQAVPFSQPSISAMTGLSLSSGSLLFPTSKQRLGLASATKLGLGAASIQIPDIAAGLMPSSATLPALASATIQASQVAQIQRQQQTQQQRQQQIQRQIEQPAFLEPTIPRRRRKQKEDLGLFGRYPRFYPVLTGKQVLALDKKLKI